MPRKVENISGQTFGKLTAVSLHAVVAAHAQWVFRCACGSEKVMRAAHVKTGTIKSCGCSTSQLQSERQTTHGHWKGGDGTAEYSAWCLAKVRCHQPKNHAFKDYGARGITMCDRWRLGENGKSAFACFVTDMGLRPSPLHTLDRRDNDNGYSPDNCRWATRKEQQRNTRSNRIVEVCGRKMPLIEAAEMAGLSHGTLSQRLNMGWTIDRAINTPVRSYTSCR